MNTTDAIRLLGDLDRIGRSTTEIAKTARRGNKSLAGGNTYGQKFHAAAVELMVIEDKLRPFLEAIILLPTDRTSFAEVLKILRNPKVHSAQRAQAVKDLQVLSRTIIEPKLAAILVNPIPTTEQILPREVVQGAGTYYERLILQANGCYERGWYDACLVMVRKFFESLVITVYEAHGKADEIKGKDNEFLMLRPLVDKINSETKAWNLGRETKPALREMREDGNRSAHTRRYNAVKADIDRLIKGIRVAAEELLHLAMLK